MGAEEDRRPPGSRGTDYPRRQLRGQEIKAAKIPYLPVLLSHWLAVIRTFCSTNSKFLWPCAGGRGVVVKGEGPCQEEHRVLCERSGGRAQKKHPGEKWWDMVNATS